MTRMILVAAWNSKPDFIETDVAEFKDYINK